MSLGVGHVSSHSQSYLPEGFTCATLLICALSLEEIKEAHRSEMSTVMLWTGVVYTKTG